VARAPSVCWADGALRPLDEAVVRADDLAFAEGRGCYTSVRIDAGRPRYEERHQRRLARAARALRIGRTDPLRIRQALRELAAEAFAEGEGIVRLELSRDGAGAVHLVAVARELGDDRPEWKAITAPWRHEGPLLAGGHKLTNRLVHSLAAEAARDVDADEALLVDAAGRVVEGARSNLIVVTAAGDLVTPPLCRGAVAGVAREVALERLPDLRERDVAAFRLSDAQEIIAINAVRGARPITRLDGHSVGGRGRGLERVARALAED
jgi:branched-subunit amino acid aminotransferase/4-amino-4-deoxychorismate lyase